MEVEGLNSKHFEARDIKALLDIDKNRLFYWIKTYRLLRPEVEASGTGSRTKFSLKNLLEIATIKEMINFGFEMKSVKFVKDKIDDITSWSEGKTNIFDYILSDEGMFKESMRPNESLLIYKSKDEVHLIHLSFDIDADYDGETYNPYPVPDIEHYEQAENKDGTRMYVALKIDLGLLAEDLLRKIKEY